MAEETLKLFVRLRDQESEGIIVLDSRSLCLQKNTQNRQYQLTGVLQSIDDQDKVYEAVGKRGVQKFLQGYSSMFFLYGANETGKTYTLLGDETHLDDIIQIGGAGYKQRGLIVRATEQIFRKAKAQEKQKQFQIFCSCLQVSKVKIADLSRVNSKTRLRIQQNRSGWFTAVNLHYNHIKNMNQFVDYFRQILQQRQFNNSHIIFEINLVQFDSINKNQEPIQSFITFVELGFIMHTQQQQQQQQMLIELNTLSYVLNKINNLQSIENGFKQSRLTKILKESICNSQNITIIGTVGSMNTYMDNLETLSFMKAARDIDVAAQRTLSNKKRRSKKILSRRESGNSQRDQVLSYASSNTMRRKQSRLLLTNHKNGYDRSQYLLGQRQQNQQIIKQLQATLQELKNNSQQSEKKYRMKRQQLNHNISSLKYTHSQLKQNQNLAIKSIVQKYQKFLQEQNTVSDKKKEDKILPHPTTNRLSSQTAMFDNVKDQHRRAMKGILDSRDQTFHTSKKQHNKKMSNLLAQQHQISTSIDPFKQLMYKQTLRQIKQLDSLIKYQQKYIRNIKTEKIDQFKIMKILDTHKYKVKQYDYQTFDALKQAKGINNDLTAESFKNKISDYLKSQTFKVNYKQRFKHSHGL